MSGKGEDLIRSICSRTLWIN